MHSRRATLLLLLICVIGVSVKGEETLKSMSDYLDQVIRDKELYVEQKEQGITSLKKLFDKKEVSPWYEYDINLKLYDEYKKYKLDSAIRYASRNVEIARVLNNDRLKYSSAIQLASLYSFSGKPIESENILKNIPVHDLPREILPDYYETCMHFCQHYSASSDQPGYIQKMDSYRDSLLSVADPASFRYKLSQTLKLMRLGETDQAEALLADMLETGGIETPEYAYATYFLAYIYGKKGEADREKIYYMKSVVADIKNALKENGSFQQLALAYYKEGDIARAFEYTQLGIEDAVSSGVQFRTMQLSEFYTIVNASYQAQKAKANNMLKRYLVLISILSLFLLLLIAYIYKQMRKLSGIKEELSQTNHKLVDLNTILNSTNNLLNDTNKQLWSTSQMKEQHIAHFFSLCSTYIDKMEEYRKTLYKLGINKQYEELIKKLKSTSLVDNELEELYAHFDSIFLNLYPTFIADLNSLLSESEQIIPKTGELLNKELRIYALLRLGITDSAKIAAFLRCSMSTIYNYRTKMRNRAATNREGFDEKAMNIGDSLP